MDVRWDQQIRWQVCSAVNVKFQFHKSEFLKSRLVSGSCIASDCASFVVAVPSGDAGLAERGGDPGGAGAPKNHRQSGFCGPIPPGRNKNLKTCETEILIFRGAPGQLSSGTGSRTVYTLAPRALTAYVQ